VPVPPDVNVNTYSVDCVAIVPPPVVNFGTYPAWELFAAFHVLVGTAQEPSALK